MSIICPVCSGDKVRLEQAYKASSKMLTGRHIYSCSSCDIGFVHPLPDDKEWFDYNASYFDSAHGGVNRAAITVAFNKAVAKIRLMHLQEKLLQSGVQPKRVLEIGPGEGYFAAAFQSVFPEVEYFAVESDRSVHGELMSNGVHILDDLDASGQGTEFDAVIISHVLEHTLGPVVSLHAMTAGLRKGGVLFIEVPCLDYAYKPIHEPHVMFFSKPALEFTIGAAGFDDMCVTYHGDTIADIRRFDLVRRIFVKLSLVTGLPISLFVGPSKLVIEQFNLGPLETLAVVQTRPYARQDSQARWLRAVAVKNGEAR